MEHETEHAAYAFVIAVDSNDPVMASMEHGKHVRHGSSG